MSISEISHTGNAHSIFLTLVQGLYLPLLKFKLSYLTHLFNLQRPSQIQYFSFLSKIYLIHKYHKAVSYIFIYVTDKTLEVTWEKRDLIRG